MGTALVIILPPVINHFTGMKNIPEPVFIQTLIVKASVKTLTKSVLCWLTRLDKPKLYIILKGPLIECATGKFRTLNGPYRRRIATEVRDAVQNTRDLNAGNTESCGDRQALLREIIHTGQALNPTAAGKCIQD